MEAAERLYGAGGVGLELARIQNEVAADGRLAAHHGRRCEKGRRPEELPAPHASVSERWFARQIGQAVPGGQGEAVKFP
jgi:hypothetical protein